MFANRVNSRRHRHAFVWSHARFVISLVLKASFSRNCASDASSSFSSGRVPRTVVRGLRLCVIISALVRPESVRFPFSLFAFVARIQFPSFPRFKTMKTRSRHGAVQRNAIIRWIRVRVRTPAYLSSAVLFLEYDGTCPWFPRCETGNPPRAPLIKGTLAVNGF